MVRAIARVRRGGGFCLVVFLFSMVARTGGAEPFDPLSRDWEGYGDFADLARAQLGGAFVIASSLKLDELRPEDTLVLVHPERRLDQDSLSEFLSAGGRVILLDDFGTGEALLRRFGIRRVPLPAHPAEELRQNPDLAIAVPARDHELVRGVGRLVTNHASALVEPSLTSLLEVQSRDSDPAVVALIGIVSRGAFVVVGDPSAFMNSMLRYPGNKRLAENLLSWASRGREGSRAGTVYLAYGGFGETGAFRAPADDHANSGRHLRASELVGSFLGLGSLGARGAHLLAALVGLLVVVWIGSRAGRTYRIVRPRLTRPVPLEAQGGVAGRAAALISWKANRARALLELGKALEEGLALTLEQDRIPSHETLLRMLTRAHLLDPKSLSALGDLLSRLAHVETLVSAGRGEGLRRVRDSELLESARVVRDVLKQVHTNVRRERAA
jgi:Domain of unknown function (DUF4350)